MSVNKMSSRRLSFVELVLVRGCGCHQQRLFYHVLFLFLSVTSKRELQQRKKLHQFSRTNRFYVEKKNIPAKERLKRKKTIDFEFWKKFVPIRRVKRENDLTWERDSVENKSLGILHEDLLCFFQLMWEVYEIVVAG